MNVHLLLVNDDGINSPLLHRLSEAAAARGHRVTVCAPKTAVYLTFFSSSGFCSELPEPLRA
jgi:broad specificity polyphosphatase/5'/3'-nucleotidase SurE